MKKVMEGMKYLLLHEHPHPSCMIFKLIILVMVGNESVRWRTHNGVALI
jgi:hypothetical protein